MHWIMKANDGFRKALRNFQETAQPLPLHTVFQQSEMPTRSLSSPKMASQNVVRTRNYFPEMEFMPAIIICKLFIKKSPLRKHNTFGKEIFYIIQKVFLPFLCQTSQRKHGLLQSDIVHLPQYVLLPAPDHGFLLYLQTVRSQPPGHPVQPHILLL